MSCTSNPPNKCKQRFKGVENFLRRVAFNLGNTPSQTEVKIISCIPIDVTDLQQKIVSLEKQLEAAKIQDCMSGGNPDTASVIQTALCKGLSRQSTACKPVETCAAAVTERCESCSLSPYMTSSAPQPKPVNCTCWSSGASSPDDPLFCTVEGRKGIFKKQKKKKEKPKKKDKGKTQFVYYAQTTNNPFRDYAERETVNKSPRDSETLSHAYISEMIRKQYIPVPIIQDYTIGSEFSSPVCRDVDLNFTRPTPQDSDVCSCCYGPFHNIDKHMPRLAEELPTLPTCSFNKRMNNAGFYDTNLYDMVPVKEKTVSKSYYESPRRKSPNKNGNTYCHPERRRSKSRVHPYINNNYSRAQTVPYHSRRAPTRMHCRNEIQHRNSPKREHVVERFKPTETSDSCCIDCGNVYVKRVCDSKKAPEAEVKPMTVVLTHKNVECLTSILNDTECQTTTTQSVQIDQQFLEEKKTEETLNQIKTILQSVLTEVKTNTHQKVPEDKPTKDAVVQKGLSQGNVPGCSTLLHSFTYSPYNMNPYLASCSRQMPSTPCCFPNIPYTSGKCMHNYPVFIQTPPRHMCASCFRNSSHIPKMGQAKQATTAATNTDSKERSKETEKLIKEIYKSMTINMDVPTKETSASEYNDVKTPRGSRNKSLYRASVLDEGMRNFVKANASRNVQKLASPFSSLDEKLMSNTMSTRSQIVSTTDTERRLRNRRLENYLENVDAQKRKNRIVEEREYKQVTPETTASDEDMSSSETDERAEYTPNEQPIKKTEAVQKSEPPKKGLFSKMFNSVKLFSSKNKRKEEQVQVDDEEDEESEDSDDYQTVYSQRVQRPRHVPYPVRAVRSPHKIRAHSKISYSRHMRDRNQERSRRSPYMEQEYRRQWNEKLMFHENERRYSSENPYSQEMPRKPVYWQNYEARSALIGPAMNRSPHRSISPQTTTRTTRPGLPKPDVTSGANTASKGLAWLKKHKLGIHCGPQWKKLILEG